MHSRSVEYHISSSEDSYARTSVHHKEVLLHPDPLILPDQLSSQTDRRTVWILPYHPSHLQAVRMEDHIFFLHSHHLHQMLVRCERLLYHLSELHIHHIQHRMLSCAVLQPRLLHTDTTAHTLFLPDQFPCKSQGFHKHLCLLLQVFQELYQAVRKPYNIHVRLLP